MSSEPSKEAKAFRKDLERMVWAGKHRDYKSTIDGTKYVTIYRTGKGTCLEPLSSISDDDLISLLGSSSQTDFKARKPRSHAWKRDRGVIEVMGGYKIDLDQGGKLARDRVDTITTGDYGADPLGDGRFRMVPSGDIVSFEERTRRLDDHKKRSGRSHLSKRGMSAAEIGRIRGISDRRIAELRRNGDDKRKTAAWREAQSERAEVERAIALSRREERSGRSHASKLKQASRRRLARAVNFRRNAGLDELPHEVEQQRIAFPRGPREPRASVTRLGLMSAAKKKRAHASKKADGRTLVEASSAGDSYQVETLDGKHHLYMPGSRGITQTLRNVRKHWKHRIGERVRIYRVLPGSRTGAMVLQEAGERTL